MSNPPTPLQIKSAQQSAADMLRTLKNGLIGVGGIVSPNVGPNTYFGLMTTALGNETAAAGNNVSVMGDQMMPDTCTGDFLDRWLEIFNIPRRPASTASGSIVATTTPSNATTFVAAGTQLQSAGQVRYAVQTGGVYGNNSVIPIVSVDTGSQTNLEGGSVLTWVSPPSFFNSTATVSALQPLTGGVDAEDDETARARLLAFFANAPGAANAAQIVQWAQQADPSVQYAFVYPAIRLGATVDVSIVGYATANSSNRAVNYTTLNNVIAPFITGNLPQGTDGYVSNVINYPIDISLKLSLPIPANSNPPGALGWLDPAPLQVTTAKPGIRVVDGYAISGNSTQISPYRNTATGFWVDFPVAPSNGVVYNISYLSPETLTLCQAQTSGTYVSATLFSSLSAHTSLYYVTVNTPFYSNVTNNTPIQVGHWVFPTAANTATYVDAFISYMASLGPGERTSNQGLLQRSGRQPNETISWNYKLNTRVVKPIIDSGLEVYDGLVFYRGVYAAGPITDSTAFVDYGTLTTNSDPAFAQYAPQTAYLANGTAQGDSYVFVPGNFGTYQQ